jgi:hypothetical protein
MPRGERQHMQPVASMSDENDNSAPHAHEINAGAGTAETTQSPMTVEAIKRDPWNAVVLDLPENGTRELYVAAADAAHMLRSIPEAEMPAPPFPLPTDDREWSSLVDEMKSRVKEAENKIHEIDVAAGRAEIIGMVDQEAHEDLKAWAEGWIDDDEHEQGQAAIKELRRDVAQRLEQYQPLRGEFASLDAFMSATEHLATHEEVEIASGQATQPAMPSNENTAAATIEAARIVAGNEEAAEVARTQPAQGFFSFWDAVENFAAGASRTVHMMLGAVIGFFVDEPKLTPQQVHDTLQGAGNVETLHAREFEAAVAVDSEAYELRAMIAKGEQQTQIINIASEAGTNATAEATLGLDAYEPQRRKQTQSL